MADFDGFAIFVEAEDGHCGFGVNVVVVNRAVVDVRMIVFEHTVDFCSSPDRRTIAVGSLDAYGAVGVVGGIEAHSCTYTDSFHFTFGIDFGGNCFPCQLCYRAIGSGFEPTFIHSVSESIGEDGSGRGLLIRFGTVEELMPKAVDALKFGKSGSMLAIDVENLSSFGMIFGINRDES